jgi:hypothetical protein
MAWKALVWSIGLLAAVACRAEIAGVEPETDSSPPQQDPPALQPAAAPTADRDAGSQRAATPEGPAADGGSAAHVVPDQS